MSTTEQGDAYERRVFRWIQQEVREGRTHLNPRGAHFEWKKRCFSPDREGGIIFDIGIEFRGGEELALLWIAADETDKYSLLG